MSFAQVISPVIVAKLADGFQMAESRSPKLAEAGQKIIVGKSWEVG